MGLESSDLLDDDFDNEYDREEEYEHDAPHAASDWDWDNPDSFLYREGGEYDVSPY